MLKCRIVKQLDIVSIRNLRSLFTESQDINDYLSFREKAWLDSKSIYNKFEHVFYSSYLERYERQKTWNEHFSTYQSDGEPISKIVKCKKEIQCNQVWPKNWMEDYEYYKSANNVEQNNAYNHMGTADDNIPSSTVPCSGCGAHLHCHQRNKPGFLPVEIFKGRTKNELKSLICQRCHFLKYYNIALDVNVSPQFYEDALLRIRNKFALVMIIIDLLDFPASIWPGIHKIIGPKRPILVVGNKVDLLPRDCNSYLDHIKKCLKAEVLKCGFSSLNVKNVNLISAKTGYGIEELITQLQKHWSYKGDVYLVGCTNVGKSSLFNILLNSDYCRPEASTLIRRATTCTWPGTTLEMLRFPIYRPSDMRLYQRCKRLISERAEVVASTKLRQVMARKFGKVTDAELVGHVGRTFLHNNITDSTDPFSMNMGVQPITTLDDNSKDYREARWVYDTPGVMNPSQFTHLLTAEELDLLHPQHMIIPRAFRLKPGMSLFVGGLARFDFLRSDFANLPWVQIFLFASPNLPTLIADTKNADVVYRKYINTPLLRIPIGNQKRLEKWPSLQTNFIEYKVKGCKLESKNKEIPCSGDIILSSAGWMSARPPLNVECTFQAWTPEGKGIFLRMPSLIPYAERIIGKRIRNSLAYNTAKPFIYKK